MQLDERIPTHHNAPRGEPWGGSLLNRYELEPGTAVGQGEILVQAWSGTSYAADRAWVWGRVPEAARAIEARTRLPMMRH